MLYDPLFIYSQEVSPYSSLPNIHPQSIDCVVRSQLPSKGSLYVSNLEGVQNVEILKKLRVSSILTCAQGYKLDHSDELITNYKYFPLPENPIFGLNDYFNKASDFIKQSLSKTNCIVHCLTGENKSIAAIISYLIKQYNMKYADAYLYIQRKRKLINLDEIYAEALQQFQKFIFNKNGSQLNKSKNKTMLYKTQQSQINKTENQSGVFETQQILQNKSHHSNRFKMVNLQQNQLPLNSNTKIKTNTSKISMKNDKSIHQNKSLQIHSSHSRQISNQNNSTIQNDYINEQSNQINKIKTQNKQRSKSFSLHHKQASKFQNIVSSYHEDYVGIKRQHKNSSMSFKKQKSNIINFNYNPLISNILEPQKQIDYLKVQKDISKSRVSQISDRKSHSKTQKSEAQSKIIKNNAKIKTKMSEMKNSRLLNPENQGDMRSKKSVSSLNGSQIQFRNSHVKTDSDQLSLSKMLSPAVEIVPSRKEYFLNVNNDLNMNFKGISCNYETEISESRINYQNRLRQLKQKEKTNKPTKPVILN